VCGAGAKEGGQWEGEGADRCEGGGGGEGGRGREKEGATGRRYTEVGGQKRELRGAGHKGANREILKSTGEENGRWLSAGRGRNTGLSRRGRI